jgi:membrane associated rhomboid family serine protease
MLIPYRVKNPWKRFPYATVSIIALNVLIYLCTTEYALVIREDVADTFAFQLGVSNIFAMFSAMFLHGDIFHLLGNMLFLWVFAPPVEDRLGIPRFLAIYFATGICGDLLQGLFDVFIHGFTLPGIGASGCIMGVMGAYWYIFSWSTVCVFYWFGWIFRGVWEVAAFWIIGLFLLMDVAKGILEQGMGGVANFAHVGGGVSGALLCLLMHIKRDSAELSQAKAQQAEMRDISLLSLPELEVMRKDDPQNPEVIRAMLRPAMGLGRMDMIGRCFQEAGPALIGRDPALVTYYLFQMQGDHTIYPPMYLNRLGRIAEDSPNPQQAIDIYTIVCEHHPRTLEGEMALYRMALTYKDKLQNPVIARLQLESLLEQYPFSTLEAQARVLLKEMSA